MPPWEMGEMLVGRFDWGRGERREGMYGIGRAFGAVHHDVPVVYVRLVHKADLDAFRWAARHLHKLLHERQLAWPTIRPEVMICDYLTDSFLRRSHLEM